MQYIYIYTIFSIETNDSVIHIEVGKSLYKAYHIVSPLQKKSIKGSMALQLFKDKND